MLPETRTLLEDLYRDSNMRLAEFLGDEDIWSIEYGDKQSAWIAACDNLAFSL